MSKPANNPSEKINQRLRTIANVEGRFTKRVNIAGYVLIALFAYLTLGGFILSSHLAIFWPTAALALIGVIALLVWSQLWRYAISTYGSLAVMLIIQVVIAGGGWTGIGFWAAGANGDGHTYLGEHIWLIAVLFVVVLLIAIGVSMLVYVKLEKYVNAHWADKHLKQELNHKFDEALKQSDTER